MSFGCYYQNTGKSMELSPAYDLCPQPRTGNEASQALSIWRTNKLSRLQVCIEAAHCFRITEAQPEAH